MEEYNGNGNEKRVEAFDNRIRNKKIQENKIVQFNINIFVLFHNSDKEQVLDIETKFTNRNIEFVNSLASVKRNSNKKIRLLKNFNYVVVFLSSKCLEDYTLMEILADNFDIERNSKNKKIIPIIIEQALYEPEKSAQIIKSWIKRSKKYEEDFFTGDYGDDITKTLEKMQHIREMLKKFLKFAIEKDIRSDEEPYLRLVNKIEEYSGIARERLIKKNEEKSGVNYERSGIVIEKNYEKCLIVEANDNSTVTATQNNGIGKDELNSIIDLIEKNLEKLNQEQAEDLQDTLSMVVEEFNNGTPRVGRLKKCITLLAPMLTVTNGIPVLAENLQKLYDYILPFIN